MTMTMTETATATTTTALVPTLVVVTSTPGGPGLDATGVAVTAGILAAYSDAVRLASDGLRSVAYIVTELDGKELGYLLAELGNLWQDHAAVFVRPLGDARTVTK